MPTLPVDVVNRALDACGVEEVGDMTEGTPAAKIATRWYDLILRSAHCAALWNFARRDVALSILGDISGILSTNTAVPSPWSYMYDWPIDCVHARWVPQSDQSLGGVSLRWMAPAQFLIADVPLTNSVGSPWYLEEGHNPDSTRVILTNQQSAHLIYTRIIQYPDAWDPLFNQLMSATLAVVFSMKVIEDKKLAMAVRKDNVALAKDALAQARVRDGDEGWTVMDHTPDWIRARTGWAGSGGGPGILFMPWTPMPFVEDSGGVF